MHLRYAHIGYNKVVGEKINIIVHKQKKLANVFSVFIGEEMLLLNHRNLDLNTTFNTDLNNTMAVKTANLLIFFDFPLGIQNNTPTNVNYLHGLVPDIAWFLFLVCALRGVIGEQLGVLCLSPSLIGSASVGCLYQFSHLSVTGQNKSTCLPGGWAQRRCSCLGRDRRV